MIPRIARFQMGNFVNERLFRNVMDNVKLNNCKEFMLFLLTILTIIVSPINACNAEQSLVYPLHYIDDFAFYQSVFMTPLGRRLLDENYQTSIRIDHFHLTGYDDAILFSRNKLMLVNDSSQGGSIALIACILNGDEAIEFSRLLIQSNILDDDVMHPYGFANLQITGTIAMYNDGPDQQPRAVLAIDPCYVGASFRSGNLNSYSHIRAPLRRWSQYFDGIIPNFNASLPYFGAR